MVLNTLSLATEEGGLERNCLAKADRLVKRLVLCFHQSYGFPLFLSMTGSLKYRSLRLSLLVPLPHWWKEGAQYRKASLRDWVLDPLFSAFWNRSKRRTRFHEITSMYVFFWKFVQQLRIPR